MLPAYLKESTPSDFLSTCYTDQEDLTLGVIILVVPIVIIIHKPLNLLKANILPLQTK